MEVALSTLGAGIDAGLGQAARAGVALTQVMWRAMAQSSLGELLYDLMWRFLLSTTALIIFASVVVAVFCGAAVTYYLPAFVAWVWENVKWAWSWLTWSFWKALLVVRVLVGLIAGLLCAACFLYIAFYNYDLLESVRAWNATF